MNIRNNIISYHETVEQIKALNDDYQMLLILGAKYSPQLCIEETEENINSKMIELRNRKKHLEESTRFIVCSSPRIVLRSIINDESIVLSDLAVRFGVSLAELDDAIEVNQGKPLVKQMLSHFGLPTEPYYKFIQ